VAAECFTGDETMMHRPDIAHDDDVMVVVFAALTYVHRGSTDGQRQRVGHMPQLQQQQQTTGLAA
jgi:hypothetical protein